MGHAAAILLYCSESLHSAKPDGTTDTTQSGYVSLGGRDTTVPEFPDEISLLLVRSSVSWPHGQLQSGLSRWNDCRCFRDPGSGCLHNLHNAHYVEQSSPT